MQKVTLTMVIGILLSVVFTLGVSPVASANAPAAGCSLLTSTQIQAVVQEPFDAPQQTRLIPPFGDKWGSHCTYRAQKGADTVVDFWVYVTASPAQAKQWFDMGAAAANPKSTPAIGDAAYVDPSNSYVYVRKGKVYYWISIAPGNLKQEKNLAASVAARI